MGEAQLVHETDKAFRADDIKSLITDCVAHWNAQMEAAQAVTAFTHMSASDVRVFSFMRGRRIPLADLHQGLGMTRQGAQQAMMRLERHGVVKSTFAAKGRREKVVVTTPKGRELSAFLAQWALAAESECEAALGHSGLERLRALLSRLACEQK
ncbi:MAG: hypothetical protein AAF543_02665 [Pseudomonadota bacterium]